MRITGLMARRLLVNWRVHPDRARRILPAGVQPKLVAGHAVVGLCLVRLSQLRPVGLPAWMGFSSENLAVRIGVKWDGGSGVLIVRRATNSPINALVGAHSHYGEHHRALFRADEDHRHIHITATSPIDRHTHGAHLTESHAAPSVFADIATAEEFFRGGEVGYSPSRRAGIWDGLRLHLHCWNLRAMHVVDAHSTLIDQLFDGQAVVDSAFIMRNIPHTWTPVPAMHWGPLPEQTQSSRHAPRAVRHAQRQGEPLAPQPTAREAAEHVPGTLAYDLPRIRATASVAASKPGLLTKWLS